ncbi:MAG: hypothetical protein F6K04_14215 [Leptolyngbya sp. SIO4C5]|nr:hypothetical protein [Leptolyngbya sp. SIO4C5]
MRWLLVINHLRIKALANQLELSFISAIAVICIRLKRDYQQVRDRQRSHPLCDRVTPGLEQ